MHFASFCFLHALHAPFLMKHTACRSATCGVCLGSLWRSSSAHSSVSCQLLNCLTSQRCQKYLHNLLRHLDWLFNACCLHLFTVLKMSFFSNSPKGGWSILFPMILCPSSQTPNDQLPALPPAAPSCAKERHHYRPLPAMATDDWSAASGRDLKFALIMLNWNMLRPCTRLLRMKYPGKQVHQEHGQGHWNRLWCGSLKRSVFFPKKQSHQMGCGPRFARWARPTFFVPWSLASNLESGSCWSLTLHITKVSDVRGYLGVCILQLSSWICGVWVAWLTTFHYFEIPNEAGKHWSKLGSGTGAYSSAAKGRTPLNAKVNEDYNFLRQT